MISDALLQLSLVIAFWSFDGLLVVTVFHILSSGSVIYVIYKANWCSLPTLCRKMTRLTELLHYHHPHEI